MRIAIATAVYPGAKIGGAEVQSAFLANGLAQRGHDVLYIATSAGTSTHEVNENGVLIRGLQGYTVSGLNRHQEDLAQLLSAFRPDLVYLRLLIELPFFQRVCRPLDIPIVSVSCSMMETSPFLLGNHPRESLWYIRTGQTYRHWRAFRAIRYSAAHVCNAADLTERIQPHLPGVVVRTVYNGAPAAPMDELHTTPGKQIIWVNNIKRWKQPELFVQMAERLPDYHFVMIGANSGQGRYARRMNKLFADSPLNFSYLGPQPLASVNRHIGQSDLLLYTSVGDGFGNSLLQAWQRCVPTGSLTLPVDGILERERIGFFSANFDDFVSKTDALMRDETTRMAMGTRAHQYAQTHFNVARMVTDYEDLFHELATSQQPDSIRSITWSVSS